jgi:hypothetical protein
MNASPKRKLRRRKGKAPPGAAVSVQPEFRLQLHVEFRGQTTAQDYAEHSVSATFCNRQAQLRAIAFAPENAVSDDNREVARHDLNSEF